MSEQTASTLAQFNLQPPVLSSQPPPASQPPTQFGAQSQQQPQRTVQLPPIDNRYSATIEAMSNSSNCTIPGLGREPARPQRTQTTISDPRGFPTEPAKPAFKKSVNQMSDQEYEEYSRRNMERYKTNLLGKFFVTKTATAIDKQEIDELVKVDREFRAQYMQMKQEADRQAEEQRQREQQEEERQIAERAQMEYDAMQAKREKVMHARAGNLDTGERYHDPPMPPMPPSQPKYIPHDEQMPAASSAMLEKLHSEIASTKAQLVKTQDEVARLEVEVRKEREQKEALLGTVESLRRELEKARLAGRQQPALGATQELAASKSELLETQPRANTAPELQQAQQQISEISAMSPPNPFAKTQAQRGPQKETDIMHRLKQKISATLINTGYAVPASHQEEQERVSGPRRASLAPRAPPPMSAPRYVQPGPTTMPNFNDTTSFLNAQESILQLTVGMDTRGPDDVLLNSANQNSISQYLQTLICEHDVLPIDMENQSVHSIDPLNTSSMSTARIPESLMHGPNASFNHGIRSTGPDGDDRYAHSNDYEDLPTGVDTLTMPSNGSSSSLMATDKPTTANPVEKRKTDFIMSNDDLMQRSADEHNGQSSNIMGHPYTVRHVLQEGQSNILTANGNLREQIVYESGSDSEGSLLTKSISDEL